MLDVMLCFIEKLSFIWIKMNKELKININTLFQYILLKVDLHLTFTLIFWLHQELKKC